MSRHVQFTRSNGFSPVSVGSIQVVVAIRSTHERSGPSEVERDPGGKGVGGGGASESTRSAKSRLCL